MMSKHNATSTDIILPEHVYATVEAYLASSEYRDVPVGHFSLEEVMREAYTHRLVPAPRCHEDHHRDLLIWVTAWQTRICLRCFPTEVNAIGVVILAWLTEERQKVFLHVLTDEQKAQQQQVARERQQSLRRAQQRLSKIPIGGRY